MFSIIQAAGWPVWPLIIASVVALAIIGERMWTLRDSLVMPRGLLMQTVQEYRQNGANAQSMERLAANSPLGQILAAGIKNINASPAILKESIEEAAHVSAINLERFLTTLGTIASLAPLMGLFGTIVGMIEIFGSQAPGGSTGGNPAQLAHGISIALYNTAFGLVVAIPSLIFWRYFRGRVDAYLLTLELASEHLVRHLKELRK